METLALAEAATATRDEALSRMGGGANQSGARAYNERLTLSLLRRNGPLPKAELARLTGLSAQTLSLMMRRLEAEALVMPLAPLRGRIGQPSVPYALNPKGTASFGIKIGRRSTDLVVCDFLGTLRDRAKLTYAYPVPGRVLAFIEQQVANLRKTLGRKQRISGIGVAMPFELWKWAEQVDAPSGALDGWKSIDVARELTRLTGLPALIANDATAACGAELARTERTAAADFLYFYIGSFIGGGVVLNGQLFAGRTGNAGALGSMPIELKGQRSQLIEHASLITLEQALAKRHANVAILQMPERDWSALGQPLKRWITATAEALAIATVSAVSVIDFQRVCIDGALPRDVLAAIVEATRAKVALMDLQGLSPFEVVAGSAGADARAIGGAMLPILANYSSDPDVLLKALPTTA